jgi:ornithine cyclodeaminase/alanine dehydrogenase-like protein (mu-crystallin family)
MLILSADDVCATITMPEAIEAVREGFIALSSGQADVPVRGALDTPDGVLLTMPSHLGDTCVVKVVSVNPGNRARNLSVIHASVLVIDARTGIPQALMDGRVLTAIRTGAASGLATDLLALPDAHILGVIGAGVQTRTQIEAVCAVRPISEIRIYSRSGAQSLVDELTGRYSARMVAVDSPGTALAGADVIVAATNSKMPVVLAEHVKPGAHINGVGSFTPEMQEVAAEVVMRARVVVDQRAAAWAEAGDLIIPRDQGLIMEAHITAELGEVAARTRPGRQSTDEITFFKSVGNAVQDNVVARRVLAAARSRGAGVEVSV